MYTSYFGLNEKPFSITPDPRYLFMSERHGEALAHLVYGVTESGGFIQLTGEVGTGKTTLVRSLLQSRLPASADVAVVLNPQLSVLEFLQTIIEELHLDVDRADRGSIKALIDALNRHLLDAHAEGRRTILIVDEAQNLAPDVLEQVRLLTNLETAKQKLLQIILIGQPELRELLARTDLRQLAQRITGRYHLEPLAADETASYVTHRLKVAGALGDLFDAGALREVFRLSQGVPRLINVICDRALLGAYARESRRITAAIVRRAAAEVTGGAARRASRPWATAAAAATVAVIAAGGYVALSDRPGTDRAVESPAVSAVATPVQAAVVPTAAEPAPGAGADSPRASLNDELQLASDLTDSRTALATLFDVWGLDARDCREAASAGYSCLRQRGSLASLSQYNRPAVLTLTDHDGNRHDVVLTAIDSERVELSVGGVPVSHRLGDVAALWFGEYLLLWRPPNGVAESLVPGSRGPNVQWLRQSLAAIDPRYRSPAVRADVYDAELAAQVRAFQRDHRLAVDGLAGQQTQIVINTLLEPDGAPRLATPQAAQE